MTDTSDSYRRWLVVGVAIMMALLFVATWSLMIDLTRPATLDEGVATSQPTPSPERVRDARQMRAVLFYVMVLAGVFLVGSFAFLRWSKRFRRVILQKPHDPSPDDDVWAMHRLPDDDDDESPEPDP